MSRKATLTRAIQTQWGLFTKGCTVKVVALDDEKAIIDFAAGTIRTDDGRELHMYSVIRAQSVAPTTQPTTASAPTAYPFEMEQTA